MQFLDSVALASNVEEDFKLEVKGRQGADFSVGCEISNEMLGNFVFTSIVYLSVVEAVCSLSGSRKYHHDDPTCVAPALLV